MRRSTIVVLFFGLVVAGIIALSQFLQSQPPLAFTIAVDPLAEAWVREAATRFNNSNPLINSNTTRVQVTVLTMADGRTWQGISPWSLNDHPTGFIPASSAVLAYLPTSLPYRSVEPSLARTLLVWGGFESRVTQMDATGSLDWPAVAELAAAARWANIGGPASWGNVNIGINWPATSSSGMAVLFSAAGAYGEAAALSRDMLANSAFSDWATPLADSVRNAQRLGESPARAMITRGASVADLALLPENQWLEILADLSRVEDFVFQYPAYQFVLDFPLSVWEGPQTTDAERAAVAAFGAFLLSDEARAMATTYGLRPALSEPLESERFISAEAYGFAIEPDYGIAVTAPARADAERLIRLFQ